MVDDPNRDILPVREGFCADTILSIIDPRERHLVCKLDRYELEDKYLRLLDEANNLKKLSNCQEDKIKRLGTKLIRLAGNPRCCGLTSADIANDKNMTSALELENTKLKEKIAVMRNQLLSHTMSGRSSSRSRTLHARPSSGLITCRSESNRTRAPSCQCIAGTEGNDNEARNYAAKIEKLEAQKKDMACRIAELEKEVSLYTTGNQREKVAENVEYIRVWRQMKQLNEKLIEAQGKNATLTVEITDLKMTLEQTTRNNQEIAAVLTSERTRLAKIDDQMLKVQSSQLSLREKDEQIRDLINEMKILQQHNNELLTLTSKYSQVELENVELRKKLSEQFYDQQTLKTAYNNEQANIVALQTINEELLTKLQELQKNIDTLTIQITSFQKQDEKRGVKIITPLNTPTKVAASYEKDNKCSADHCKRCCQTYDKIAQLEKIVVSTKEDSKMSDKSIQTITIAASMIDRNAVITAIDEERRPAIFESPLKQRKSDQETICPNFLSREKILKLLDQAQINTPLDASRIAQKEEYTRILDVAQRHSDEEIPSQTLCDESCPVQKSLQKNVACCLENQTLNKVLIILFDVLQEYLSFNNVDQITSVHHQTSIIKDPLIDINNNFAKSNDHSTDVKAVITCDQNCIINPNNHCDNVETNDRPCKNITNDFIAQSITISTSGTKTTREKGSVTISKVKQDTSSSMKETFSATPFPIIYEKCKKSLYRDVTHDSCEEKILKTMKPSSYSNCNLTCHWQDTKDLLSQQEKQKLLCKIECLDDKLKLPTCPMKPFPLLITDRQGIIEIHISRLQLSTSAAKIPQGEDICNLCIYISWDVWGEKTAYTPRMKCPNLNFNSSSVYRITDLFAFFKNVLSEYLIFRVNTTRLDDTSYTLARAKVSIKDILDYPQNKLHYIVPVNSIISRFCDINFGQLSLWIRLSCNVDMVEAFKKQCGITSLRDIPPESQKQEDQPSIKATESEHKNAEDIYISDNSKNHIESNSDFPHEDSDEDIHLDTNNEESSLANNDTDDISDEEIIKIPITKCVKDETVADTKDRIQEGTPKDSASMTKFKALLTNANENGISLYNGSSSTIHDMNEVFSEKNWEEYRQRSFLIFARTKSLDMDIQDYRIRKRNTSLICEFEKDTIIIEIVSMSFLDDGSILENDEIQMLYVEYSFLGHRGEEMETVSLIKPEVPHKEMFYNFRKEFRIDEKTHSGERNKLHAMLSKSVNPNVKFIIISEPLPEETETKDCQEIGFVNFNIRDFALGDGSKDILLLIRNDRNKEIGVLKIIVLGFDAIRQCLTEVKS